MAQYPSAVKTFTTKADGAGNKVFASHINDVQDEITAMETALLGTLAHNVTISGTLTVSGATSVPGAGLLTVLTITDTGTKNNFDPGVLDRDALIFCNNATALTITGLKAGYVGQRVTFVTTGAGAVIFNYNDGGSSAANRFIHELANAVRITAATIMPGAITYVYNSIGSWLADAHTQGTYADYTTTWGGGSTIGNGTLTSQYKAQGNEVHVTIQMTAGNSTSFGASAMTFTLPFTSAIGQAAQFTMIDNSAGAVYHGTALIDGVTATMQLFVDAGTAGGALAPVTSTVPVTWATSDRLFIDVTLRATH